MTDDDKTFLDNVEGLITIGEENAEAGARLIVIPHPNDPAVAVIATRERDSEGSDRLVYAHGIQEQLDQRMAGPARRAGVHALVEVDSLIHYINRHKSAHSIAWANPDAFRIEVVFDEHPAGPDATDTAWRKHRAVYTCPRSSEWKAWTERDGRQQGQEEFGDFIEARLEDLRAAQGYPKPLEVLEMARHLVMHQRGTFERKIDPTTGNGTLINKIDNEPHSTVIHRAFVLGIPVFEGGELYQVEARVRFALVEGRPLFSYTMHRRKEIERDAFSDVRTKVAEATGVPMLAGTP